jgi:hypothetical protein
MLFACFGYAISIFIAKIEYIREIFAIITPGRETDIYEYQNT